jgi:hypothetical protein
MENENSNYDLFDRMISNEKKARSWTIFWITLLCVMGGVLIGLMVSISDKNKTIARNNEEIERQLKQLNIQADSSATKDALIKTLQEDCNRQKNEMSDSLKEEVTKTISSIKKIESGTSQVQQSEKNKEIDKSIKQLNEKFQSIKVDFQKEKTRLFIQYNYTGDMDKINRLMNTLKNKSEYLVTPPEFVKDRFSYLIKCYNYEDARQESWLIKLMADYFSADPKQVRITHEQKKGMSPTVELWIGSPNYVPFSRQSLLQKNK